MVIHQLSTESDLCKGFDVTIARSKPVSWV
jgi:hypothetical protein